MDTSGIRSRLKTYFTGRRGLTAVFVLFWISLFYYSLTFRNHGTLGKAAPAQPFPTFIPPPSFKPGTSGNASTTYSCTLVMGKLMNDDVAWLSELPDSIHQEIYTVDSPNPGIPANKGHEAMVYLTYIIDHYDSASSPLPDVVLFFHPHRITWHNNILLNLDTLPTITKLSLPHVIRTGYMNSRCHHDPGCPDWLHIDRPAAEWDDVKKAEERFFTSALWRELHPGLPFPARGGGPGAISQPCCAQFAVSAERIRQVPLSEYVRYRDWLLRTKIPDEYSGRIMEYTWQTIFTGQTEFCPEQHLCYCDGYGICFGGEAHLQAWLDLLKKREVVDDEIGRIERGESGEVGGEGGGFAAGGGAGEGGKESRLERLRKESSELNAELIRLKIEAEKRGEDPRERAQEGGREWREGDGY